MDLLTYLLANGLDRVMVMIVCFLMIYLFDRLTPDINFLEELHEGNMAVAVMLGSLFLAMALAVGGIR